MLLKGYTKEIFRPECNHRFQSVHCIAHLDQNVGEALPYLNAELGGFEYFNDPPAVTFRILKMLPHKVGCGKCGNPTCMVFATLVARGVKGAGDCPVLPPGDAADLEGYMKGFNLEA